MSQVLRELEAKSGTAKAKVLIVDDRPENLLSLEKILRSPHFDVIKALSGNEALGLLLNNDFSCILLDVQMPEMDGFETARYIRGDSATRHIPIIFVTAYSKEDADILRGYDSGCIDYLLKPLNPNVTRAKVSVFVDLFLKRQSLQQVIFELQEALNKIEIFNFAASHELKTPIRSILLKASILLEDAGSRLIKEDLSHLDYIMAAARRELALLDRLKKYYAIGHDKTYFGEVDLAATVHEVLEDLADAVAESKAKIAFGGLPKIFTDPLLMHSLFLNLISNAIKYRKPGQPAEVAINVVDEEDRWLLKVADLGVGIDNKHFEKIFEPFQRLHASSEIEGTGMGLAICKRIVASQGGSLWLESILGKGTTFFIAIPKPVSETLLMQKSQALG